MIRNKNRRSQATTGENHGTLAARVRSNGNKNEKGKCEVIESYFSPYQILLHYLNSVKRIRADDHGNTPPRCHGIDWDRPHERHGIDWDKPHERYGIDCPHAYSIPKLTGTMVKLYLKIYDSPTNDNILGHSGISL